MTINVRQERLYTFGAAIFMVITSAVYLVLAGN